MNLKSWVQPIVSAVLTAALVMLGLNLYVVPQIAELQAEGRGAAGTTQFTSAVVFREAVTAQRDVTVIGAVNAADLSASDDLTVADDATITGDLAVNGPATLTGAVTYGANVILSTQSITPAMDVTFTPTAQLVTLTPAGALGTTIGACTTGQKTILYNSVNATVTITDTGNFVGAGNAALTQFDTLSLVCIDSKWVQLGSVPTN